MTENEAKLQLKAMQICLNHYENVSCDDCVNCEKCQDTVFLEETDELWETTVKVIFNALEELEQYRAIGTVEDLKSMKENGAFSGVELAQLAAMQMRLREYQKIGTIEEFKALKEKSVAKKPIRNDLCTCPSCGTYNEVIGKRRNTVAFDTVYCWHCGQAIEIKRD